MCHVVHIQAITFTTCSGKWQLKKKKKLLRSSNKHSIPKKFLFSYWSRTSATGPACNETFLKNIVKVTLPREPSYIFVFSHFSKFFFFFPFSPFLTTVHSLGLALSTGLTLSIGLSLSSKGNSCPWVDGLRMEDTYLEGVQGYMAHPTHSATQFQ